MSSSDYVERAAALVVDANIAIGFILGGRTRGTQIVFTRLVAAGIPLLAPEELLTEVDRHLTEIVGRLLARRHATEDEFRRGQQEADDRWREMQAALRIVPTDEYWLFETPARRRIPRDTADWPYVALALRMDCAIWTKNVAHFAESGIPIWSLETIELMLEE